MRRKQVTVSERGPIRKKDCYAVDGQPKIFGSGLGTQARAMRRAGERTVFSQFVHEGDNVQVRYQDPGGTRLASEVHVTRKGN